jgi:hypothetical protein
MSGNFVVVRRNLASGEVADETAYAPIGLWHDPPPRAHRPAPPPPLLMAVDDGRARVLRRAGSATPLATSADHQYEDIAVSGDGRYAASRKKADAGWQVLLFRGDADEPRELAPVWAHSFVWLPAAQ